MLHSRDAATTAISFLTLALCAPGCATGDAHYAPPASGASVELSLVVTEPVDKVWEKLVLGVAKDFFVINNLARDSGFLNVSYAGPSDEFVDAGTFSCWVSQMFSKREYSFPAAQELATFETFENGIIWVVTRSTSLEGRINIVVAALNDRETRVTVNTRYMVTATIEKLGEITRSLGETSYPLSSRFVESTWFNSGSRGVLPRSKFEVQSNGALEKRILGIVRAP